MTYAAYITITGDAIAFLMMLSILVGSRRVWRKDPGYLILRIMMIGIMVDALCNGICYAMHGQKFEGAYVIAMVCQTILELALVGILYLWLLFVDYQLYGSRDHLLRHYRLYFLPVILFFIMLLVNPFTGILFTQKPTNVFERTALYNVMLVIEYSYVVVSVIMIIKYRKENGMLKFFRAMPMVLPIAIAILASEMSEFSFIALGFAAGMMNIYIFMKMAGKYEDEQAGFYNASYLSKVKEWEEKGHRDKCVILRFMAKGNTKALAKILREELPRDAEILNMGGGRFLLMAEGKKKNFFDLVISMVKEATDEFNRDNSNDKIELKIDIINQEEL